MRIDDLIKKFEAIKKIHGNLRVMAIEATNQGEMTTDVEDMSIFEVTEEEHDIQYTERYPLPAPGDKVLRLEAF